MNVTGKKVFVGLSGGVDSAVSAALLKEQGALVTGVFIKGWYPPNMPCTWAADRRDAMRVAARLQIPFRTLDASADYKKYVIDYLLSEYKAGRTPNPDIMCNKEVKFGVFYRYAHEQSAEHIATGHYIAGEKDQRYFLWAVPKDVLENTIFPVSKMEKKSVRALARKYGLPVAEKSDSQGVCFLGSVSIKEFLERELKTTNPALLHTIGERIDGKYVVAKDVELGTVTTAESRASSASTIKFANANWHREHGGVAWAQYRYRGPLVAGRVSGDVFTSEEKLPDVVAPGQSVVFYGKAEELIGGGIIIE